MNIGKHIGIDKAIAFTSLCRMFQAVGGIISIILVARYLTGVQQGFYYTFGSIVAIQIFFELGLNGIITQYVAHEAAHLNWKDNILEGEHKHQSRLSSLLHFCVKWYLFFAAILFIVLLIVGFMFFNKYAEDDSVRWQIPWLLLSLGTSLNLLIAPILSFIEGLGKVKEIAKLRLCQYMIGIWIIWLGLIFGLDLYVSGLYSLFSFLYMVICIQRPFFKSKLINIWKTKIVDTVNYRQEIFPYQWKIALSWMSGYFIFQLFNPVLFAFEGAIVAGQMGMTIAALNGIQGLSLSWISTKIPVFSSLIATHNYNSLDSLFNRTLKQSVFINGFLLFILFMAVLFLRQFDIRIGTIDVGNRFLPYIPMLCMMIALFINQFVSSWATYLRCHKQEPYLINSIVGGVLCGLSTFIFGKYVGVYGVTISYLIITLLLSFWAYKIYKYKKNEWHG